MKLVEALVLCKTRRRQNKNIHRHIHENVRLPEDREPTASVKNLFAQYEVNMPKMLDLLERINKANCLTKMNEGTITDALAKRNCLQEQIFLMQMEIMTKIPGRIIGTHHWCRFLKLRQFRADVL
jgi:hypothetical protein